MKCDSIVFDLDGTLWNAAASTATAWTKVFTKWNLGTVLPSHIEAVAGRPYLECLNIVLADKASLSGDKALLEQLEKAEQEELRSQGADLYGDVEKTLIYLKEKGLRLFLVSNCKDWYLDAFLAYKDLGRFFEDSTCFGQTGLVKHLNLENLRKKHNLKNPVYIGDTASDMKSAALANYDYIHVSFGFEPQCGATRIIHSLNELREVF